MPAKPGQVTLWKYDPPVQVWCDIRMTADMDGPRLEDAYVRPGEVFAVIEERPGEEGMLFLRLADGRGWLFDTKPNVGPLCVRHSLCIYIYIYICVCMYYAQ